MIVPLCFTAFRYFIFKFPIPTFKGALLQIWKSANIFGFTRKYYVEDFTLKHFLRFEIFAREIYEEFVCKHSEATEYDKK